ncbi:uncharacterized protein PHACADRAFT_200891 [Phanerochaete carnosa HHB-10118-sp]|uniref:Uncharacterized protein n=1 Tax=Phanerochaete carnosa (strain HHB-10118-sp) TaxID=650164 RepID=K5VFT9_PHACS|nr:uncharacterized protein PHACADRAFT_200891 [Phanerochaete carnosa HHB-10118-sp]EKM50043.1 hypothetical protein PHACADRAFT_200891 [Phanerochaete carnosa HHB-10118-sp]
MSYSISPPPQTPSIASAPEDNGGGVGSGVVTPSTARRKPHRISQPLKCERCGYILHVFPKEDASTKLASHHRSVRCQKAARARINKLVRAGAETAKLAPFTPPKTGSLRDVADDNDEDEDVGTQRLHPKDAPQPCYQCGADIEPTEARYHVGRHILRALLGVNEKLRTEVNPASACGFCGRSGTCKLILPDEALQAPPDAQDVMLIFSCKRACMSSHDQVKRYTSKNCSTNVPVACAFCLDSYDAVVEGAVHWKFSIFHHIQTVHPEYWDHVAQRVVNIPETFVPFISVSQRELREVAPDAPLPYPGPVTSK